ncbi:HNH endonuclease [Pseudovibrio sp. Alg231-02]|uniref:HNH endonuclease n=1 Tax=Pseudovibrio sp. Alg231-02 TaxID=1922223 RepID=UPI000D560375|nr:HNH endonuclease signature motif containing protein [Pseudovibrio sp. Alg231-02]
MRKLKKPPFEAIELYDESVAGWPDEAVRRKFEQNRYAITNACSAFDRETLSETWCRLPRARHGNEQDIVAGTLTKAELVALYDVGVVRSKGKPRTIYDTIKLSAHGECPYCGGIGEMGEDGEAGTVDHYLPKSRFPAYSILPLNLVPACAVCNKGMGSGFPTDEKLQPLHPYLDKSHFFNEKWTTASVEEGDPIVVNFGVNPPAIWSDKDRQRVKQHFLDCNLGSRYRARVPQELSTVVAFRKKALKSLSPDEFSQNLLEVAQDEGLPINGWKRTLYCALAASEWFCRKEFA